MAHKTVSVPPRKKRSRELEKLELTLRRCAADPAHCADLVRRTNDQLLSKRPRLHRERLERYHLDRAAAEGRKYFTPEERAALEDDPDLEYDLALLNDARIKGVPARPREVLRLYRAGRLTCNEIASRLKVTVETVKRNLVRALKGIARVDKRLESEGVVE